MMSTSSVLLYISVVAALYWSPIDALVSVSSNSHATPVSSNANLSCTVTGVTFMGWKDPSGRTLTTDSSQRIYTATTKSRHDLIIKNVQKSDKGVYHCVTSSETIPVTLHVQYSPSLVEPQSTIGTQWSSYSNPDPLYFRCQFDGYPVPTIVLSKDGKIIKTASNSNVLTYSLITKTINEFGFYACVAKNNFGEDTHYIEVAKLGPPEPPANVSVSVGCESVRVDWIPPFNSRGRPVTSYRVELLSQGLVLEEEDVDASARNHVFYQVEKLTNYELRVNCKNSEGKGPWETRSFKTNDLCDIAHAQKSWYLLVVVSIAIAMATTL